MGLERAAAPDVSAVEALLSAAGLPLAGAADALAAKGLVAREGSTAVGAAAIEQFGEAGLLRSVVVAPQHQGAGLGQALVAAAEQLARDAGVRDLYLVTETAAGWFARLGYEVVGREDAQAAVGESIEMTTACAVTGVPMRRLLR